MKLKKQLIISSIVACLLIIGIPNNQKVFSINSDQIQTFINPPQSSVSEIIEQWNTTWGWSGWELGMDITMDSNGDIYIVGITDSFGAGGDDIFVAKYDITGYQLWNETWGGSDYDWGYAIATDSNNDVYIAGKCDITLEDLGDAVLVKFSSEGDYLWERKISWSDEETWFDIAIDSLDLIYLVGKTESYGAGGFDIITGKYDTSGNNQWGIIYTWGYSDYESGTAITVDNSGYVYISGITNSSTVGDFDAYLFKIDASGYEDWNRTWGGSGDDIPQGIAVDNDGHIYITGYSNSPGTTGTDIFLTKYDDSGTQKWNKYWGLSDFESTGDIIVNGINSIYVCGGTNSSGEGGADSVLIKFDATGSELWNRTWGGADDDWANGITLSGAGYIYITGITYSFGPGSVGAYVLKYVDNTPPSITSPVDIEINQGTSDQNPTWIITDLTVDNPTYTVYRNGTENETGSWTSGQPIVYNLDNFDVGSYNLTIMVSDGLEGSVQDEVLVDVLNNPPILTQSNDVSYEKGTSDQKLSWTVTDTSVSNPTYIIYRNGTQMGNGSWTSGELFAYNLIDLQVGIYNFTIVIFDGLDGSDQDEVLVTVTATIGPVIGGYPFISIVVVIIVPIGILIFRILRKRKKI